jgi:hypothetical protein
MAIAYRSDTGEGNANGATNVVLSFVSTQPQAGDLIVGGGSWWENNVSYSVSVTDNQGNSYSIDQQRGTSDHTGTYDASEGVAYVASAENITASGTVTVTFDSPAGSCTGCVGAVAFSGANKGAAYKDVGTHAYTASDTASVTIGPTGTTSVANAVVATAFTSGASASYTGIAPDGTFTALATEPDGNTQMPGGFGYKIITSTGTQSATWSWTGSLNTSHVGVIQAYAAATISRTDAQHSIDASNPFGITPAENALMVMIQADRSGASHTTHGVSDSGGGWTKAFGVDVEIGDTSHRRSFSAWYKKAGASQDTSVGSSTAVAAQYLEFETTTPSPTWPLLGSANNNNGVTENATSIATGTAASTFGNQLVIPFFGCRNIDSIAYTTAFTSRNIGNVFEGTEVDFNFYTASGWEQTADSGTKAATATITGTTGNTGLIAGILVFGETGGAVAYAQHSFRVRNDDGSESAASWKAALNTDDSVAPGNRFRLRFLIDRTN